MIKLAYFRKNNSSSDKKYTVGICQLVQHEALDAATKEFKSERAVYKELLKTLGLGLENHMTSKVGLLSGGQRQALTLLMATLKKPKLLLLDEHTAAIVHGNRLIMMMDGNIILDIKGEEKKKLTVEDLLHKFEEASGEESPI